MNRNQPNRISFGPFILDLHTQELWKDGVKIKLSGQPVEILSLLLQNPGRLVTREQLRDLLWPGDTFVDFDHGLNAAINKLREALSDSADAPTCIETLPRRGYRFISNPSDSSSELVAAPVGFKGGDLNSTSTDAHPSVTLVSKPSFWAAPLHSYFFAGTVLLVLVLAGTLLLQRVSSNTSHQPVSSLERIRPLTNLAGETSEPAFSLSGDYVAFRRRASSPESSGLFVQSISTGNVVQLTRKEDDCCPAWSPDGRSVAFSRDTGNDVSIYIIPFDPTAPTLPSASERKMDTSGNAPRRPEIAWSPDGKSIVFTAASGLMQLPLHDSRTYSLTVAPPSSQDWGPVFSPDGRQLLFVRSGDADFSDQLLTVPATGGDVTQIVSEHARILGPPQWSTDGQSILFASGRGSHPGLWRVSAQLRDYPVQINDSGWYPAISRSTSSLAYQRITRSLNIWELHLSDSPQQPRILVPSTSETDQGPAPQISPDGKKLAYMSDRSGTMEIWVSNRDGSNPLQLTSIGDVGTPRWSPDSQSIVFDAAGRNTTSIYRVNLDGTSPRLLTPDNFNVCPSWSRDFKWIYFASSRTGTFQVWKIPAAGGTPTQVTFHGGHASIPSSDGKVIYYAKSQYANPEIWQIPTNGGPEKLLSPLVRPATWASWAVTDRGIVFATSSGKGKPIAALYDIRSHKVTTLASLNIVPFWLTASPDGKSLLFDQPGWQQAQIMLVDNFH
jgi:Tol biopolymer transport system component/DNA-binding winged helix-turn-helix (wHTH) protein